MTSKTWTSGTVIDSTWLQDTDSAVYKAASGISGASNRTAVSKFSDIVSILDFGADNTGVNLCNTALDNAKAACKTVYFPPGTYRIENYTLQDLRIVGARSSGANTGSNEQTIIEGSGDIFVGANNFSLEHLVLRNSSAGTRGKLITVTTLIDTKIGPFIDVDFRKATYHIYMNASTKTIVDADFEHCRFSDANTYSRYFVCGLYRYSETACYNQSNKRALYITNTSTAHITDSVFELHDEGAIYVENTASASDVIRSLKFQNLHFEQNGHVTPSADITVNVTLSLGRLYFDSCGFYLPSVAKPIELSSSPTLRIYVSNCTDIDFNNIATTSVIAFATPKRAGQTDGFYAQNGNIGTTGQLYASQGFHAQSSITATITGSATPTPVAMPAAGETRLVIVADSTTPGAALLMLNNGVVSVITSTLTSITWSVVSSVLNGNTTGGASSRVLFFNYLTT